MAAIIMTLDMAALIRIMPEWTHPCVAVSGTGKCGGNEEALSLTMIVSAVLDFVTLFTVSMWFGYTPVIEPHVRRDRLPNVTITFVVLSFLAQLVILAFYRTIWFVVALFKIAGLLRLLMRG